MMESSNLERAIDLLTSDDAAKQINAQIEQLESKLAKLKKLRKAMGGGGSSTGNYKLDEATEKKAVAFVKKNGPCMPGDIAKHVGQAPINIGRLVSASELLTKRGSMVVLVEG